MAVDTSEDTDSDDIKQVYSEDEFWYKIDVDWEEVKETYEDDQSDAVDSNETETTEFDEGRQAESDNEDKEEGPDTFPEALLLEFSKGKRKVIEAEHETVPAFVREIQSADDKEIRQELRTLYVQYEWSLKQKENEFTGSDFQDVLSKLSDDGTVVRDPVDDTFDILWPGNSRINKEVEGDEVTARKHLRTEPVIVKRTGDSSFSIRGSGRSRGKVIDRLRANTDAEEVEPDRVDESVSGRVSQALSGEGSDRDTKFRENFKIVSIQYKDSALPDRSKLTLKNDVRGVRSDMETLRGSGYLPSGGMAGLDSFRVEDIIHGGRHKIELQHLSDGFQFLSETSRKTDDERERFERRFSTIVGVEFDTIYSYDGADDQYLLNRILTGEYSAYERFYGNLSNEVREFVDDVLATDEDGELVVEEKKTCLECGALSDPEEDTCSDCGEVEFNDPKPAEITIDNDAIASKINRKLKKISPSHERVNFLSYETTTDTISNNRVAEVDVKFHWEPGQADLLRRRQVRFAPTGTGLRIQRFNSYMLEAAYVTYSGSEGRQFLGFGTLPLYDLLFREDAPLDELVGHALYDAFTDVQDRVAEKARESYDICRKYLTAASRYDDLHEHKDELSEHFSSGTYFEKQVFYLLKFLFSRSERWGKESERESDGAIVFPKDRNSYHVLSYDTKRSFSEGGYDFDPAEEDQATRYILYDNEMTRIRAKTGDDQLDAHIMISQHFNENHFDKMAQNMRSHFDVFTDGSVSTTLAFMDLEAVVKLYELKRELYEYLGSGDLVDDFNDQFLSLATTEVEGERYARITTSEVEQLESRMARLASELSDDRIRPYSKRARDDS
ncbi:hypothetical protein [Halosimplex marinum]|uniref:hypothetical protein n=1 Tax=Halosimplex marinum TaxID=3396620 RepID=UPI003F56928A